MSDQTAPLPPAALTMLKDTMLKDTMLAAGKLSPAGIDDLKAETKSNSVVNSRFSSVDSFDTLMSPPSASPPSTPGRSDDDVLVPRIRRASTSASSLEEQPPKKATRRDFSDFAFVTFFALGAQGDSGHTGFQFTSLDTKYARVLKKSHPGSRLALLTDMDTRFDFNGVDDIEVLRYPFDRSVLGRNAYANLYQFQAQLEYLKKLQSEGAQLNVVFMDNDIFVFKSIARIFENEDFDYGCTISDSKAMPVNIGMQFVKKGRYGEAIRFLEAVIKQYRLDPVEEFCAGQIAIGEVLGLYDSYDAQLGICAQAAKDCYAVRTVGPGQHRVAFLSCTRYNYCNLEDSCCTDPHRWMKPLVCPQDFLENDVCALHFVGWRKSGMPAVFEAFMRGDLEAGFQAFVDNYKKFAGYDNHGHDQHSHAHKQPVEVPGFYKLGFA